MMHSVRLVMRKSALLAKKSSPRRSVRSFWGSSSDKTAPPAPQPQPSPAAAAPAQRPAPGGHAPHGGPAASARNRTKIPGVAHIVAVASGKGGVGKSTVSVNLALALMQQNLRIGLLDADIYGPSIPTMMNLSGRPHLVPLQNYGIRCMSMGFLVPADSPTIWRGPMVMGAIDQMLHQVDWGQLDVLVIDLPPGTGDAQLTLTQRAPLSGAVIVSTPQEVALVDARRGLNMFKTVNVPILGIVENMSYFECPCGQEFDIFGRGGAKNTAEKFGVDFLGEIPLVKDVRELSDAGKPIVISKPESKVAKMYGEIAKRVIEKLQAAGAEPQVPKIVIE